MAYERLEADAGVATARRLQARIQARFPDRNLGRVAGRLVDVASDVERAAARTAPIRVLRVAGLVLIVALVVLTAASLVAAVVELASTGGTALSWLSGVETVVNDVVYVGIAVVFLWLLPTHLERSRILGELHRLRSLAHVIDMHQLTKDPERFADAYRRPRVRSGSAWTRPRWRTTSTTARSCCRWWRRRRPSMPSAAPTPPCWPRSPTSRTSPTACPGRSGRSSACCPEPGRDRRWMRPAEPIVQTRHRCGRLVSRCAASAPATGGRRRRIRKTHETK